MIALSEIFDFNDYDNVNDDKDNEGLKSGLKAEKTTQDAPIGSPEVEGFLKEIEQQLIAQVNNENYSKKKERDKIIAQLLENLRKSSQVVIATDKTNSFQVISTEQYKIWVLEHLQKFAKEIDRQRLVNIFNTAKETSLHLEKTLS